MRRCGPGPVSNIAGIYSTSDYRLGQGARAAGAASAVGHKTIILVPQRRRL